MAEQSNFSNLRILVVDDDPEIRNMLKFALDGWGCRVDLAENGQKALLKCSQERFDVILLDIVMPEKEGIETIGELRRRGESAKIMAMSGGGALPASEYLKIAALCGASEVLAKPFSITELQSSLSKLV